MEAENIRINNNNNKKRSSRKPLADCTNLSPSSSTSSTNNIPSSSSFKKPPLLSFSLHKFPNTKNKPGSTPSHKTPASKSAAVSPPTPSHPPESSPLPGSFGDEIFEPHSVYTRRQSTECKRKSKGRASFTPAPKTEFASYKMNDVGVTCPSKSLAVHRKKRRCRALSDGDEKKHALPQDYIEQQRAYFAEIDAFELSEEEFNARKILGRKIMSFHRKMFKEMNLDRFLCNFPSFILQGVKFTVHGMVMVFLRYSSSLKGT
ncbi:uncharacterized protein LOC133669484 [Populus nigra]|uniref:uncharacterized protein LOC133669484 n=1 Tax=Populus nigra TaxID=3691 RepID=UPI002B27176F|nr:uncharacterized protein LOC133669484 [Populus nigra]